MIKTELKAERVISAITALNDLLKNYPGMNQGHHLFDHLSKLLTYAREKNYAFEVLLLDKPDELNFKKLVSFFNLDTEATENLANYLQANTPATGIQINQQLKTINSQIKFYTSAQIPARTTGQYIPALKFIFWFDEEVPPPHDLEFIQFRLEAEGGLSLLFSQTPVIGLKSINNFRVITKDINSIAEADYTKWLLQEKLADKLDLLKSFTIVKSLEKLSDAFSQYLDQEENDIRTRKFGTQQEVNNLKQQEKLNHREAFQRIKTDLQRDFSEFEKGIGERISSLNRLQDGSLLSKTENSISQLSDFEETEAGIKVLLSLPKSFQNSLLSMLKGTCEIQIEKDIFSFKDFVEQTSETVRKNISSSLIEFTYQPKVYFNRQNLISMIDDLFTLNKEYITEKRKLQTMDYFRAATKPLMIIGSLTMPLLLISSGKINLFAFLKSNKEGSILNILIPMVILGVIGYNIYSFFKSNKVAEEQLYTQELKKMRDNLKSETRSMLKRFIDEWGRLVKYQIIEEQNNLTQSLEYAFSESAEGHKQKLADSQRDIQRRMQGLEQRERAHSATIKSREQYDKAMSQLKGEINQVFIQSTYES